MRAAFPGTFDPPTVAHLAIAEAARAQCGVDVVDLVVNADPIGKAATHDLPTRIAMLEAIAASRPWLRVVVTDHRLLADIADGYDVLVVGADKWAQVVDPRYYGGSPVERDAAVARLPDVAVAPRAGAPVPDGCVVLDVDLPAVSSTAARSGAVDVVPPEARPLLRAHVLDNPAWHALAGPQGPFAEGAGGARRYRSDVCPFVALPDDPTEADWADLVEVAGGGVILLFRQQLDPQAGWTCLGGVEVVQLVATDVVAGPAEGAAPLGPEDADAMAALVAETEPGPWAARTFELGRYVGIRDGGRLVAMAGERMRPPGWVEVSAVCTAGTHRRRGLATALVADVVAAAEARGERACLHAVATNVGAIAVYEAMGFTERRRFTVAAYRPPPPR
jgi:ribosomal protein S18 acetylase RimI-like enzyme